MLALFSFLCGKAEIRIFRESAVQEAANCPTGWMKITA